MQSDTDADADISTLNTHVVPPVEPGQNRADGMMGPMGRLTRLEGTKQAILERLLPHERHVLAVADELRIRESAIRRHFDQLEAMGLVRGFFRQEGLGRPKKYYTITDAGKDIFPRSYAQPLAEALRQLVDSGAAKDLGDAILVRARQRVEAHGARLREAHTPLAKARILERVFGELGVVVRPRPKGQRIFLDYTGSLVLRTAVGDGEFAEAERKELMQAVLEAAHIDAERDEIRAGEMLVTPPSSR